ncbi:hypothetical protein BWI97_08220 [Siphonobacter sp. BAB-5405]|uniref:hypothetical protein n=1 Tax=Siphonobacter sp. BAB-5405 TaxID=1864825 RepID=UPI000C7FF95C|nr:hypothetical protein [Siphonobacter sp. BAB-5405]PMD97593.1 hypothetical protein BWI97_08220 [Siphonobacter sp. BAB-5405]
MKRLENQVAVITNGTQSAATTLAEILRNEGAKVLLVDEDKEALQEAMHRLGVGSGDDLGYTIGSGESGPSAYAQQAIERFGKVDLFIALSSLS